ncbi:MAG: response regulator [Persicimonas sp.]
MQSLNSNDLESTANISIPEEFDSFSDPLDEGEESGLASQTEGELPVVLVVDDEVHILKAVKRVLTDIDCEVRTASNGEDAIDILDREDIAVLISDQCMPGLSGLTVLSHARENYPTTVRIMLTGVGDMSTVTEAVNKGQIFRYVAKPWDRDRFMRMVDEAIEHHELRRANERYEEFIREQNERLRQLNDQLEELVRERTKEVTAQNEKIRRLNEELEESFSSSIKALLSIMELGDNHIVGHCRRTADRVEAFGEFLGLDEESLRHLERASLLHWVGLINAPPSMFEKPVDEFDAEETATWEFHPTLGQQALAHVPALERASTIIMHYLRRYDDPSFAADGGEYSEELVRDCAILHICSAFEHTRQLEREVDGMDRDAATECGLARLQAGKGREFDPSLVDSFASMVSQETESRHIERKVTLDEIDEGMVLSRPVETAQGVPVAPRDVVITPELIERLERFRDSKGLGDIFVRR